jgi:DNA-directed RNA polymerase subunit RPC12/RpoP
MPLEFRCTSCRRRLQVPKRWAGRPIDCPRCQAKTVVPQREVEVEGGVFESRSVERSLSQLFPQEKLKKVESEAVVGTWDVSLPTDFAEIPVLLPDVQTGDEISNANRSRRKRHVGTTVGFVAVFGIAVLASAAVIAGYWLLKR